MQTRIKYEYFNNLEIEKNSNYRIFYARTKVGLYLLWSGDTLRAFIKDYYI